MTTPKDKLDVSDEVNLDLSLLIKRFREEVPLRDRNFLTQHYKQCFEGNDAVKWIMENTNAASRADAVNLLDMMMHRHVFQDVNGTAQTFQATVLAMDWFHLNEVEGSWLTTLDGVSLYYRIYKGHAIETAVMIFVHGLGDHSARNADYLQAISNNGFLVVGFDLRGHGNSPGKRGHATIRELMSDVEALIEFISEKNKLLPVFVYGHGLGGMTALTLLGLRSLPQVKGVVVTSLLVETNVNVPIAKEFLGRILQKVTPKTTIGSGIIPEMISKDPAVCERYRFDPLVHSQVSLTLGKELLDHGEVLMKISPKFMLPLLMIHGDKDVLSDPLGARRFFKACGSRDKKWHLAEGLFHDIEGEPERFDMASFVSEWMRKRS